MQQQTAATTRTSTCGSRYGGRREGHSRMLLRRISRNSGSMESNRDKNPGERLQPRHLFQRENEGQQRPAFIFNRPAIVPRKLSTGGGQPAGTGNKPDQSSKRC